MYSHMIFLPFLPVFLPLHLKTQQLKYGTSRLLNMNGRLKVRTYGIQLFVLFFVFYSILLIFFQICFCFIVHPLYFFLFFIFCFLFCTYYFSVVGHTEAVTGIVFDHTGNTLASCSADMSAKLWDLATYTCIKTLKVRL